MSDSGIPVIVSSIGSLTIIFGLLFGTMFLLRRLRGTTLDKRGTTQTQIKLVASRPLGGQNTLVIAEAEGHRFLIGISRNGMTSIGQLGSHE